MPKKLRRATRISRWSQLWSRYSQFLLSSWLSHRSLAKLRKEDIWHSLSFLKFLTSEDTNSYNKFKICDRHRQLLNIELIALKGNLTQSKMSSNTLRALQKNTITLLFLQLLIPLSLKYVIQENWKVWLMLSLSLYSETKRIQGPKTFITKGRNQRIVHQKFWRKLQYSKTQHQNQT